MPASAYATISRKWQKAVEAFLFSELSITQNRLPALKSLLLDPRRLGYIRSLSYKVTPAVPLPPEWTRLPFGHDVRLLNLTLRSEVKDLWDLLGLYWVGLGTAIWSSLRAGQRLTNSQNQLSADQAPCLQLDLHLQAVEYPDLRELRFHDNLLVWARSYPWVPKTASLDAHELYTIERMCLEHHYPRLAIRHPAVRLDSFPRLDAFPTLAGVSRFAVIVTPNRTRYPFWPRQHAHWLLRLLSTCPLASRTVHRNFF